jgi:Ca2+-binding RTX toxin-like protein
MQTSHTNRPPAFRIALAALMAASIGAVSLPAATAAAAGRTCFGKRPTIVGTQGNDVLHGTTGRDVIVSLGGNDHITAGQGRDYICAGPGDDNLHGAEGVNHMNGGPGDDWLDGRRGPGNVAIGSKGDDLVQAEGKIDGGGGNDTLHSYGYQDPSQSPFRDITEGGAGRDRIYGCGDAQSCYSGDAGNRELLKGGARNDRIFAGGGSDKLRGNGGSDKLHGEAGDDDIDGGSGTDVCDQGPGTGNLTNCP